MYLKNIFKVVTFVTLFFSNAGIIYFISSCSTKKTWVENDVPIDHHFFKFNTDEYITGWSEEIINNPSTLDQYNSLNLSGQTFAGDCAFTQPDFINQNDSLGIFNKWTCQKIDLSNTYWAPYYDVESSLYASGYYSFAYADLSHCLTLDLSHSSFALSDEVASSYVYVYTADNTFFGANLSNLISLNLSNVIFANVGIAQYDLFTASNTFNSANLSSLSMLDLSNDVFACSNMTSKDVYTAYNTFLGADLSNLNSLNFGRAIFAANNMTTQNAYSAYNTFAYANFSHFNTLVTNDIRIGNDNSGLNTINSNCFNNIIRNVDWTTYNKLKLKTSIPNYWNQIPNEDTDPTGFDTMNNWFGTNNWQTQSM